jgi:hypothetical protein
MTTKIKLLTSVLALVGPLTIASTPMGKPQSDDSGDEHYHHEYYSHSYVDPNYRDEQEPLAKTNTPKKIHHGGKPDTGVSIALGGHRLHKKTPR